MPNGPASLSDKAYRLLVDAVADYAIYVLDTEGRISSWNKGAQRLKGYTAEEVFGRPFSMFFTEKDRRRGLPEAALEVARREGRFESEGWRERKDGTRFWAFAILDIIRDDSGRHIGFAKITRDMTERHEAQQALLESERLLRTLVEGVTDAFFLLDADGTVTSWNPGAARMKGYTAEEIIGQNFSCFYTEEDRASGVPQRALEQAEARGRFESEGWRVRKDGTRFWANAIVNAIRDDNGDLIGFAKVTRDITEQHEAQRAMEEMREQLVQSQKLEALGQLTGGIAHDFNNLLQAMTAGVSLAEKLAGGNEKLASILAEMRAATARGADLTRQLLAFSRRAPTRSEVIDTRQRLQQAAKLFSRTLRGDIEVELQLEDELWSVRTDQTQFELALLNVALNARDAMPNGGALVVSARNRVLDGKPEGLKGRFVAISLRDTGDGIPQELLGRIFEPFFTTKPLGKGTGLGLSQVYGFARQSGGAVTIDSEPGRGTTITFLLPAASEGEAADGTDPSEPSIVPQDSARILVVDDDAMVGRLTAEMLESVGYSTEAVTGPELALERLRSDTWFDIVLSDVLMRGGMDGVELGREIRRCWPGLPVLLTTGFTGRASIGEHEFPILRKPFATPELAQAVGVLLARRRTQSVPQDRPPGQARAMPFSGLTRTERRTRR